MTIHTTTGSKARLAALFAALTLTVTGCTAAPSPTEERRSAAASVTVTDAWAKAADEGMSAGFGTLANGSDGDVTVVAATTAASSTVELHETVADESGAMVMREVDGGFVIPAGGALTLEPGGAHLMLMGLTAPLRAGEEVTVTLTFSDDSSLEFTAPVKDYSGANETYEGDTGTHMGSDH